MDLKRPQKQLNGYLNNERKDKMKPLEIIEKAQAAKEFYTHATEEQKAERIAEMTRCVLALEDCSLEEARKIATGMWDVLTDVWSQWEVGDPLYAWDNENR